MGGGSAILLHVQLFGRVLVCTHGYRAERQRVLTVWATRGQPLGNCSHEYAEDEPAWNMTGYPTHCGSPSRCWADDRLLCVEHALAVTPPLPDGTIPLRLATDVVPALMTDVEWRWFDDLR